MSENFSRSNQSPQTRATAARIRFSIRSTISRLASAKARSASSSATMAFWVSRGGRGKL